MHAPFSRVPGVLVKLHLQRHRQMAYRALPKQHQLAAHRSWARVRTGDTRGRDLHFALVSAQSRADSLGRETEWPGRESNPRHADFQSAALPTELPGRYRDKTNEGEPRETTPASFADRYAGRFPTRAVTMDLIPPRVLKSPTTSMNRGRQRDDKSSRMRFTARS